MDSTLLERVGGVAKRAGSWHERRGKDILDEVFKDPIGVEMMGVWNFMFCFLEVRENDWVRGYRWEVS